MSDINVTLHDVARVAGVSISTASRALTGNKVSKTNQEKVDKAARELGYVANEAARSLRNTKNLTIGVVFNQLNTPLATELLDALASTFEERGYSIFVSTAQGQDERFDKLVWRFLERRVEGLLCVNATGEGSALARYESAGIPVAAVFHASGGYADLPLIAPSIVEAVEQSVDRLMALGHQRLAILRPMRRSNPLETYQKVARQRGMSVRIVDVGEGPIDGVAVLSSLMTDPRPPTVVMCRQAEAVQLAEAADEMSILIPNRLSLVAARDRAPARATRLPMSMIHLNPAKVGIVAAERMLDRLTEGVPLPKELHVEMGSWFERSTIGPAPATASADEVQRA